MSATAVFSFNLPWRVYGLNDHFNLQKEPVFLKKPVIVFYRKKIILTVSNLLNVK